MSLFTNRKSFIIKSLALTVTALMVNTAQAATDSQEIQQLRNEVQELKALLQQQQQQVRLVESKVESAPASASSGLKSKSGADINIYGFVRGDANYIIEGADDDFNKVNATTGEAKDKLRATAKTTRIGLDFNTPVGDAKVGGKVEVDFAGNGVNENLRIRHAYLTYNNWLFGQTTSNFLSSHAPEMIDFATNLGGGTTRIPQVRYAYNLAPTTKLLVAAEEGNSAGITGTAIKYSLPVLTGKVTQSYAGGNGNASARVLVENYKDNNIRKDKTGWGIGVGTDFKVADPLKLFADASYVVGNSNYLYGSNSAYSVVNGDIEQNEFTAVQVGGTYKILPNLRSTLAYGALFADNGTDFAKANPSANEKVQQAWLNVIYSPAKPIDLGIEYINGKRETFAGQSYKDNRVGLMAKYNF
ncbi:MULTISPECIES: DcaP family trimeric outer membrane transporter [Acinetobacter]|uniref:DcaP family trimeric outer membrane transporter n=1 Tax=Acinetobacter TaxID=469 RepID=UPI00057490FF|nr:MULTISPECIES: DcaP family trimeric outer membrane transporter [Acinetobacter]KKW79489.1 DcaP-like protein [Acinetobacter sp. Ag2]MBJ9902128.1 DcaP-like protein [Acinetobacter bereziniae]MCU4318238.1 DcaP-like protein [Acinetobacter bereziniae]MCU4416292.1 DcaP-like protein [Acinetobacter bereziniae]MCU4537013.1 DcaP-like protein [Acinetobacter bereziniae]